MDRKNFDVIVIGSGPGGYVAAIRAAELGLKTACIEKESSCGGTCLNVGCIPSKALLQATEYYALLKTEAQEFGIMAKDVSFDFEKTQDRKKNIVKGLVQGVDSLFKKHGVHLIQGEAQFTSPHSLKVTKEGHSEEIEGQNFIIATGSKPIDLPFLPFDEKYVLSSTGALNLLAPPKRMLMIGAGVIGVELASVYNRLGSEVIVLEMLDRICPAMDNAISKHLLQSLKKQGITFYLGAKVESGKVENQQVSLNVTVNQELQTLTGDVVLVAVGRRPYARGLNLEGLGLTFSRQGSVQVDANFRTSLSHIYAIGDLIDGPMLAHKASQEGITAVEIIAGLKPSLDYASLPNVIYTHPEAAAVGLTEEEALKYNLKIASGIAYFKANARARCAGNTEGFVKVLAEKNSGKILGLHIIGSHASELIAEGVLAIKNRCTLKDVANTSHAHPTFIESIQEACNNALY